MTRANLVEVFSSIQGEGPSVGQPTLFVRFGGCDLRCAWCDSPNTWTPNATWRAEESPGSATFRQHENPASQEELLEAVTRLDPGRHRWISLTGGEPLLQGALPELARGLASLGPPLHLETHGLAWRALPDVLPHLRAIAMDWKLASEVTRAKPGAGEASFADAHRRFLAAAAAVPELCVKLVITARSEDAELDEAFRAIAELAPAAILVLQPVTDTATYRGRPDARRLHVLARRAADSARDVRVIPQTHPIYGAL